MSNAIARESFTGRDLEIQPVCTKNHYIVESSSISWKAVCKDFCDKALHTAFEFTETVHRGLLLIG